MATMEYQEYHHIATVGKPITLSWSGGAVGLGARIGFAGVTVSTGFIVLTLPQIQALNPKMGPLNASTFAGVYRGAIGLQTGLKSAQYLLTRQVRDLMDLASPSTPALNKMASFGLPAPFFQCICDNQLISDTYRYTGLTAKQNFGSRSEMLRNIVYNKIAPGFMWFFLRESVSTGGGIVLGSHLSSWIENELPVDRRASKFLGGLGAGCVTALCSQSIHNTCLTAGAMVELGERPSLFLTKAAFSKAVKNLGVSILWKNYTRRVGFIAISCGVLNATEILN